MRQQRNEGKGEWEAVVGLVMLCLQEYFYTQQEMQSPIEDTIKDQIIKYGTIALDALIELIAPFLPPFIEKEDVRSISILLLSVITPAAFVGGAFVTASALSDVAIFGFKTATEVTKFGAKAVYYTGKATLNAVATTASITTDLLIIKPLCLISYPFRRQNKKNYEGLFNAIAQRENGDNRLELEKFQEMSKDSKKVFLVIRKIDENSDKISLRMVGNLYPNEQLGTIIKYLKQKDLDIENQSIQFICNRNIINSNTRVGDLSKNAYGFVDLYYTKMQTFG